MRKYVLAALLAATAATPALAQEAAPFTGLRVEGIVGYDKADTDAGNSDGVTYGGAVGYDIQAGGAVLGIEAEASDSTVDECSTSGNFETCSQIGRDLYVGGRVGTVIGSNTLLYGKAGYVNGRAQTQIEDTTGVTQKVEIGDNLDGVRVGAGLEHAIGPNSFVKAEYRYSNYEAGLEKHQGVVGLGFRF